MINKIKCYKYKFERGFLGENTYTKVDITNQLTMPIYDSTQLDGVLDTSQIWLINGSQEPLNPLTKIIIELYENDELVEKIYRVVDNDQVTLVAKGNSPIYRHTILLVEITKILERHTVDNLTFTNYLYEDMNVIENNSVVEGILKYSEIETPSKLSFISVIQGVSSVEYSNDKRIFAKIFEEANVKFPAFNIYGVYLQRIPNSFETYNITFQYEYKKFEVYKDNELVLDDAGDSYTFLRVGNYVVKLFYECNQYGKQQVVITFNVECVPIERKLFVNNMESVIQRLLNCQKALIKNVNEQQFILDSNIIQRLNQIEAPEFAITQGNLFEALEQVGRYFNAIPRLIPNINGDDDYSNWNVITFDFLDDLQEKDGTNYSLIDLENPSEEYATDLLSNVQNATISNYSGNSTIFEPCKNGYLSARTESAVYEVSDNEAVFKTEKRINKVVKARLLVQGEVIDITRRIIEKSLYDTKSCYLSSDTKTKSHFLYYTVGEKNIYGLTNTNKTTSLDSLSKNEALKNIIKSYTGKEPNLFDVAINIEYIPFVDFKVRQYKTHISDNELSTSFFNQQANEVDIEAYGENMHLSIEQTGNLKQAKTHYFKNIEDVPKCGDYYKSQNDRYAVFGTSRELFTFNPIKATISYAKNFTQLLPEIAIKRSIRQFEISERESKERNIDIQNFCVIDTETPTNESPKLNVGFGYYKNLEALTQHFNNALNKRLTSATICRVTFDSGEQKNIMLPTSFNAIGRSIVCYFAFDDNYSAGTYIDTTTTSKNENNRPSGSWGIENYIPYCDEYGKFKYLDYMFIDEYNASGDTKQTASYYLYNLDEAGNYFNNGMYNSSVQFGFESDNNKSLIVDKDNRECISVTTQLNFITPKNEISIHSAMVDTLPYITENGTVYKWVVFENEQEPNGDYAKGNFYELGNMTATRTQATASIKLNLNQNATANGKAYGIITSDNRLCVVVNKEINQGDSLEPLHLNFRPII